MSELGRMIGDARKRAMEAQTPSRPAIPEAAIEAAAEAIKQHYGWLGNHDAPARAAIEAAMPAIRDALAQEVIWAKRNHPPTSEKCARCEMLDHAARIVRGGTE